MDLAALKNYLSGKGVPLTLSATDTNLPPEFQSFLGTIPYKQIILTPGNDGINLQGSVLTISGASADTWPVQGMKNVSVTLSRITIIINDGGNAPTISGQADASLPLTSSVKAPVIITSLDQVNNPWQIKLAESASGVTPTELLLLGKGGALPFEIPPKLDVLSQALTTDPAKFQITFYPNTTYEVIYRFGISAPEASWEVIKGIISFNGIDLDAFIMTNSIFAVLTGHLKVGNVGVDVGVALNSAQSWTAFVKPSAGNVFPGLSDLASWIGGSALSGNVSTGFGNVKFDTGAFDTAIEAVSVNFNPQTATLNYLDIKSLLSIGALNLDIVLRLPNIEVIGSLHDNQPVKVKDMLASFGLQTDGVPDSLSITSVVFDAQPQKSFYMAGMAVDNAWTAGPVDLEKVDVTVTYSGIEGFTGQFACRVAIGTTATVDLMAEYGGAATGWSFSGGTAAGSDLKIGDLISDLASKFGIPDVPQPIKSIDLTTLNIFYETGTGKFTFKCVGFFEVSDAKVTLAVNIDVTPTQPGDQNKSGTIQGTKNYSATFTGTVIFAGLEFDLIFNTQSTGTNLFVASYSPASVKTEADDPNETAAPPSSIKLHDLVADVSASLASSIPPDIEIDLKDVKFIFLQQGETKQFSFGLDLGVSLSLADVPLVGDKLPKDVTLSINNLQFAYSSVQFTQAQAGLINPLLPVSVSKLPANGLAQGIIVAAELQLGQGAPVRLALGGQSTQTTPLPVQTTAAQSPAPGTQPAAAAAPGTGSDGTPPPSTKWIDIQKQFGIFQFKRIGFSYQSSALLFSLDAAITLGPLTFSMDGLTLGSRLTEFKPTFDIRGLGLSYMKPPLEISGGLLKLADSQLAPDVKFQFDGEVVVKAEEFGLSAIASYAQLASGDPSLFVFAQLEYPLGGPPAFFITGLMLGFGFNRSLAIPEQNQVQSFPLLLLGQPPAPGLPAQTQDPASVLQVLEGQTALSGIKKAWIQPQPGSYWIAVGLEFTSFEIVTSKALLIAEFGNDFQLVLLGLSTMSLPMGAPPAETYAYVELQLKAVLRPQDGFFGLTAVLSNNSYVIAPACHLTGGFAFYVWFGPNPYAGQFVITLGGYHPAFKPPSYFPQEPRLGFNWAVSSQLSVKGNAYFALTTSCVMAGGGLEALFHDGDLSAWFTAHADLLISWHPFFFTAHIDVDIGVSYRLNLGICHKTISVSIGATVDMWGPPTGGRVHVHLAVVSFTVRFGSESAGQNNNALKWDDFKSLLPTPADVCKITLSAGMYKTQDDPEGASSSKKLWIVRASQFSFFTQSSIPASSLRYGAPSVSASAHAVEKTPFAEGTSTSGAGTDGSIDVRPMNLSGVTSTHSLSIYYDESKLSGAPQWKLEDVSGWTLEPRRQNVPDSLWGAPPSPFTQMPDKPSALVITDKLVGYAVRAPQPAIGSSRGVVPLAALDQEVITPSGASPLTSGVTASDDYMPAFSEQTIARIEQIMEDGVKQNRDAVYKALSGAAIYGGANDSLSGMASKAGHIFSDSPMQQQS